jgi:hypothetical protein
VTEAFAPSCSLSVLCPTRICLLRQLTRQTTSKANKEVNQEDDDQAQQNHELDVLPPHPPLERATPDPKVSRIVAQAARLVDQNTHMLSTLQHALNVLRHNLPHAINFPLGRAQSILLSSIRAPLLRHHALERTIEACTSIRWQTSKVCLTRLKLGKELLLQVGQEAKGNALAELALRDDEERQAAGAGLRGGEVGRRFDQAVDELFVLVDCAVRRGFVVEAGEDDGDKRGGVGRGGCCVFG